MSNSPVFSFRQRFGHLNWKHISSIDVNEILEEGNIVELQAILDNLVFSVFHRDDVINNSIENVAKLVHIMQLMIEYLLHCQESQYQVIDTFQKKNHNIKKCLTSLEKEKKALKEDVKIYQRQIAILRQSLTKAQDMVRDLSFNADFSYGKPFDPLQRNKIDYEAKEELDNKNRKIYFSEMQSVMTNGINDLIKAMHSNGRQEPSHNNSNKENSIVVDDYRRHLDSVIQSAIKSMETTTSKTIQVLSENAMKSKHMEDESTDLRQRQRMELQQSIDDIRSKQNALRQREDAMDMKERQFEQMKADWNSLRMKAEEDDLNEIIKKNKLLNTSGVILSNKDTSQLRRSKQASLSGNMLLITCKKILYRKVSRFFRVWSAYNSGMREVELINRFASEKIDLKQMVSSALEKSMLDTARYNALKRSEQERIERERLKLLEEEHQRLQLMQSPIAFDQAVLTVPKGVEMAVNTSIEYFDRLSSLRQSVETLAKIEEASAPDAPSMSSLANLKLTNKLHQTWILNEHMHVDGEDTVLRQVQSRIRDDVSAKCQGDKVLDALALEIFRRVSGRQE